MISWARSWLLSGLFLLATACTGEGLGPVFSEISEEESDLQFYGPGLAGGPRQIIAGYNAHDTWQTTARYRPIHGRYPQAKMIFYELPPGRYYRAMLPIEKDLPGWGWFDGNKVELGTAGVASTQWGNINFVALTADEKPCVAWRQTMGTTNNYSAGTMLLYGYYCGDEKGMMTETEAASIVKLVGHRKYGPLEPPEDWIPALPELTAEIVNFGPYVVEESEKEESEKPSGESERKKRNIKFESRVDRIPD